MTAAAVELVLDARAELGEGPRWDARGQRLLWVDIMRGRIHAFRPGQAACRSVDARRPVGALACLLGHSYKRPSFGGLAQRALPRSPIVTL